MKVQLKQSSVILLSSCASDPLYRKTNASKLTVLAVFTALATTAFPASNYWARAMNGYWDSPSNWTLGTPLSSHDMFVDYSNITTTFRTGSMTVKSFTNKGTFAVTGGSLTMGGLMSAGAVNMTGGSLTLNDASSITQKFTMSGGDLYCNSSLLLSGTASLSGGAWHGTGSTSLSAGFTLSSPVSFYDSFQLKNLGTGTISSAITMNGSSSLFNNTGATLGIEGNLTGGSLINQGIINASQMSTRIWSSALTNTGTINVSSGTAGFTNSAFDNSAGTIKALDTTVSIAANQDTSKLGNMTATGSGKFVFTGALTNNGLDLSKFGSTKNVEFTGSIIGGTITNSDRGIYTGVKLYDVTLDKGAYVTSDVFLYDALKSNGIIELFRGKLNFMNDQTFDGRVKVSYSSSGIGIAGGKTLRLGSNAVVDGGYISTYGSSGSGSLINDGLIRSTSLGGLLINVGSVTNNGTILGQDGLVTFDTPNLINNGIIRADGSKAVLEMKNNLTVGLLQSLRFTNGGSLFINGNLSNATLDLASLNNPASITFGGLVTNSSIINSQLGTYKSVTLDHSSLDAPLNINGGTVYIRNGSTLTNPTTISNNGSLWFQSSDTVNYNINLLTGWIGLGENKNVTFDTGNILKVVGDARVGQGTQTTAAWLRNKGLIDASNGRLILQTSSLDNSGTILAHSNGIIALNDLIELKNSGTITADGVGSKIQVGYVVNGNGFQNLYARNGATVNFQNANFTTAFDPTRIGDFGSVIFEGYIKGTVVNSDKVIYNGAQLLGGSFDKGFTLNGTYANIQGAVSVGDAIRIRNGGGLAFYLADSFGGNIVMDQSSSITVHTMNTGVSLDAGGSITGAGSIKNPSYSPSFEPYLINNGLIQSNLSGQVLNVTVQNLQNNGIFSAVNGSTLVINPSNPLKNYDSTTHTLTGGTFEAREGGTLNLANVDLYNNKSHLVFDGVNSRIINTNGNSIIKNLSKNEGTLELLNGMKLNIEGNFTQSSGGQLSLELDDNLPSPLLTINGLTNLGGTIHLLAGDNLNLTKYQNYDLIHFTGGYTGQFDKIITDRTGWETYYTGDAFGVRAVPEPASIAALLTGLSALLLKRRKNRK